MTPPVQSTTNADRRAYLDKRAQAAFHEYCILPDRGRYGGHLGQLIIAQFANDLDNYENVLVAFEDAITKARQVVNS